MSDGKFTPGNRAAEKYTLEEAITFFRAILHYFETVPKAYFLNQACNYLGYYVQLPHYLLGKFGRDADIEEASMRIVSICEERVTVYGGNGQIDKTMALFILKCRHNWREYRGDEGDEQKKIVNNNIINIHELPAGELKRIRDLQRQLAEATQQAIERGRDAE